MVAIRIAEFETATRAPHSALTLTLANVCGLRSEFVMVKTVTLDSGPDQTYDGREQ